MASAGAADRNDEQGGEGASEALGSCALALGEAAESPADVATAADALVAAIAALARSLARSPRSVPLPAVNPFTNFPHGADGALACCIVGLDHLGQRAVASGAAPTCLAALDALLPLALAGGGDLPRGELARGDTTILHCR
jgi:hypothetical protein